MDDTLVAVQLLGYFEVCVESSASTTELLTELYSLSCQHMKADHIQIIMVKLSVY